ncbi:1-phosphofructokinase [Enterococcus silesiacus]|uniref:Tagatose-6-phosphate kinase n=1 Tax=Enterococcus silesiacus TaxID=332949 RepID=A0A0S3KDN6_9ENTE|nr:1-phosphofructokinase family hexose kinase [Enterococcus silesiacus]ALS02433.1 1-phosphofructokinase [Enterococcus silesiacus]OJG88170.1 1-phosphofructokinase family hexose kinase [Enterococcus silesiacus]
MILTVTLNPSIDSIYFTDTFVLGEMNRCNNPIKAIGGKGINAGRTAAILGGDVTTTGVLAGINGKFIQAELEQEPFKSAFFPISGESRNAVTVMDQEKNQTEIVELGPEITDTTAKKIIDTVIDFSFKQKEAPVIALCGSANTKNEHLYQDYLQQLQDQLGPTVKILTDISGKQLQNVVNGTIKPYFIKPNIHEFAELVNRPLTSKQDVIEQLNHPLLVGIPFILVSCGGEGAVAKYHERIFDVGIPAIDIINPTGSGDATVGGVAFAIDQGLSIEETLRYGMACGMSNALEQAVGYVSVEIVDTLKHNIVIHEIEQMFHV